MKLSAKLEGQNFRGESIFSLRGERRNVIAECLDEQDAAHIVKCVNAHNDLVAAVSILAQIPLDEFGHEKRPDSHPLMGWNDITLTVGHVRAARDALKKAAP